MEPVNPFIVSGKILPDYFCDRKHESQQLAKSVINGNNVVLISPRRMGKTGLIRFCYETGNFPQEYNTFFIDILQTTSLREFTYILGREIFNTLKPKGRRFVEKFISMLHSLSGQFGFDAMNGTPTFNIQLGDITAPEYTLEEIFRYISESETHCIVAIDEFQQVAKYPEKNIEALLRNHIQNCTNANFIFAGSERHIMQQMFLSAARPFYNSATIMELKAIPADVYTDFATRMFAARGKSIDAETVGEVYTRFEGHTYYMQKALNYCFSNTPEGGRCKPAMLQSAIDEMLYSLDSVYRDMLSRLTLRQKELLFAIADEKIAENITSEHFIRRHALSSASAVQAAAKKLVDEDIVTHYGKSYYITDRLLAIWLGQMQG